MVIGSDVSSSSSGSWTYPVSVIVPVGMRGKYISSTTEGKSDLITYCLQVKPYILF